MKEFNAKILSNKKLGANCYKIVLNSSCDIGKVIPGQFIHIRCGEEYDPLLRRPFSISGFENDNVIEILFKAVGKGTEILSRKKEGELLDVIGPLGNGFNLSALSPDDAQAILVAGGVGVAPLLFLGRVLVKEYKVAVMVLIQVVMMKENKH